MVAKKKNPSSPNSKLKCPKDFIDTPSLLRCGLTANVVYQIHKQQQHIIQIH